MTDKHICPLPGCGLEMVFMGYPALDGLPGSMWFCTAGPPDSREHQLSSKVAELEERLANRLFTNQLAKDKIYALQAELVQAQTRIAEPESKLVDSFIAEQRAKSETRTALSPQRSSVYTYENSEEYLMRLQAEIKAFAASQLLKEKE